ncbi:DUF4349 domain-containing protein [Demequina sp. NBRC 110054]|uniref:DUF4349 domain-containing protein n=1 Tax=Demequina sp. NBRC 110054 TaxID=1570343 RepID=UPI0013563827|nr:DUF4349 domain-containing protein [Demequina sp. NBRC 110054]
MNAVQGGTRRTGRGAGRAWVIAGLVAMAGVLAGCSGSATESAGSYAYDGADSAGEYYDEDYYEETDGIEASAAADSATTTTTRSLIVTGNMYMTVEDPIVAADKATSIVEGAGGRIDARSETAADEYDGGSAWLTLRIPADRLDATVEELRDLGTVDEFSTSSYDVTTEVIDLDAKISTLRASTERIEALLDDAADIKDIIQLEDELASRQAELQSLEAQQRGLGDQVSLSTIDLSLTTEPIVIIEEESPSNFWDGLVAGWEGLVAFLSALLVILGVLLPWLAVAAILALGVVLIFRSRRARKARAAEASQTRAEADSPQPAPPSA